jgi:glycosyltransferase family protein
MLPRYYLSKVYYYIKSIEAALNYLINNKKYIFPFVFTIEESIDKIIKDKVSVCRYGDGEFSLMNEKTKTIVFQKYNSELNIRLREIITSDNEDILICLPESFRNISNLKNKLFHIKFIVNQYRFIIRFIDIERKYYNSYLSRPYRDFKNKENANELFLKLKQIWENREVILVEGEFSRIGVGTDLFDNTICLQRLLCPTKEAFEIYDKIYEKVLKFSKDKLLLIALGPTATVLAYDLAKSGFQAIDIGHIGSEYFSFLKQTSEKYTLTNKNFEMYDKKYADEIIGEVKSDSL